jgi:hypothetical protein
MKKFIKTTAVLFALIVAIFCTCSNDSGSSNNQPDYNMTGTYTFNNQGGSCTWSFTADGNYQCSGYGFIGIKTGTWSAKGNDITISYSAGSTVSGKEVFTVQENGNQLTLTLKDGPVSNVLVSFSLAAKSVVLTKTSSSGNNGGGNTAITLNSISELKTYLSEQPDNSEDNPYLIKLKVSDLGGDSYTDGSVGYILRRNEDKYVSLDLSGSTITSIGDKAFSDCVITSITIPNSVTSIGDEAFSDCVITSITIPDSVTSIGDKAFYSSWLTSVTIGNGVKSSGDKAFSFCGMLASVTIPDSVTSIGDGAFYNSSLGRGVTIGNGVTRIGSGAFSYTQLYNVTIPNSVTFIGRGAFSYTELSEVTFAIGSNISTIEDDAFPEGSRTGYGSMGGNALREAYYTTGGKAGTYKRTTNGSIWTKQP